MVKFDKKLFDFKFSTLLKIRIRKQFVSFVSSNVAEVRYVIIMSCMRFRVLSECQETLYSKQTRDLKFK